MKPLASASASALALALIFLAVPTYGTNIITGSINEFTSPDDLLLNPGSAVIAVDVFGDADRIVNGVNFQSDKAGGGTVTNGGVSLTTSATNSIDGWTVAPAFTGADPTSAANLAEVMSDIRWEGAPGPVSIGILGLTPDTIYDVQLLFNEGADRSRVWDIAVNNQLAVDNISSEGNFGGADDGVWAANNSFAYQGQFAALADGSINIAMQRQFGGDDFIGLDNNPILQGIVLHQVPEPSTALLGLTGLTGLLCLRRRR
ncbi:MAG: hypothetical protein ACI9R3_001880 [Verrucomicrobiales bacterium]|jgi:hypothetical protein